MNTKTIILSKIKNYDTIIIHRHIAPDLDALGSQLGLAQVIKDTYPEKSVKVAGTITGRLAQHFIMDNVKEEDYHNALVIVVDTADHNRIDGEHWGKGDYIIKIDHHPAQLEENYGCLSWVDTTYSSASEMLAELFLENQYTVFLNEEAAQLFYLGITGDTGRFLHSNTTSRTLSIASHLLDFGVDIKKVNNLMGQCSLDEKRLLGYAITKMVHDEELGLNIIKLDKEEIRQFNINAQGAHIVKNAAMNIEGVRIAVVLLGLDNGGYKVSIRSKTIPINDIAVKYNGGGHPLASGCMIHDEEEYEHLISDLRNVLE